MKRLLLSAATAAICFGAEAQTEVTIELDTRLMFNSDCNLNGDGVGGPAPVERIYMHSGACSENRGTDPTQTAEDFCAEEIVAYGSDVWQHVVGNWGDNPQDDGVGLMTHKYDDTGDSIADYGVFYKTFVMEDYYSDASLVSTESNTTGSTVSAPMDPNNPVHLIGLVFRDPTGDISGRDQQQCNDIFVINVNTNNPRAINGSDNSDANYVKFSKRPVSVEERSISFDTYAGPNPVLDELNVRFSLREPVQNATVELVNMIGQTVYSESRDFPIGTSFFQLATTNVQNGMYVLNIYGDNANVLQKKLLVNH